MGHRWWQEGDLLAKPAPGFAVGGILGPPLMAPTGSLGPSGTLNTHLPDHTLCQLSQTPGEPQLLRLSCPADSTVKWK